VPVPPVPVSWWQQLLAEIEAWIHAHFGGKMLDEMPKMMGAMAPACHGNDTGPIADWFKQEVMKIMSALPAAIPIVFADIAAGKSWMQILMDLLPLIKTKAVAEVE
jgi:hypothetical protein